MRANPLLLLVLAGCGSRVDFDGKPDGDSGMSDETDADTDADTDSDTDADSDADTDSDTDADTDTDTDTDTYPGPSPWDTVTAATLEGTHGPALVTLLDVAVHGDVVVGNGINGYLWVSTDGGLSWTGAYDDRFVYSVTGVAVTDDGIFVGCYDGILRSEDDGETWAPVNDGLEGTTIPELVSDGEALYATSTYGERLYRWNGAGWDAMTTPTAYLTPPAVDGDTLWTGDFGSNVYVSHDGGASWTHTGDGGVDTFLQSALDEGVLLGWNVTAGVLRRSDDGGYSWTDIPLPSGAAEVVQRDGVLYATVPLMGVFASDDDGADWDDVSAGLPSGWGRWVQDLAVTWSGELLASTYQGGPYRYDGTRWAASTDGMAGGSPAGAAAHDGLLLLTYGQDVPWSYDADTDAWTELDSPASGAAQLAAIASNGETILASSAYYGLYRSTDDGRSWTTANEGLPMEIGDAGPDAPHVYDVAFLGDTVLVAHSQGWEGTHEGGRTPTGGGASVSFDAGLTWSWRPWGLPQVWTDDSGEAVYPSATAAHASAEVFLLGTVQHGVYRSVDEGYSWEVASGIGTDTRITDFARIGATRWAAGEDLTAPTTTAGNGLWRSDDAGATWVRDEAGLPELPRVAALASTDTTLFALVTEPSAGIWRLDGGAWSLVATPDTEVALQAPMVLDGEHFFVATAGAGMLELAPVE